MRTSNLQEHRRARAGGDDILVIDHRHAGRYTEAM